MTPTLTLIGRSTSHYTRVVRMVALELGIDLSLEKVHDLTRLDAANYGDNPARKVPSLRTEQGLLFGTENICRALAERAGAQAEIVWPEELTTPLFRNAQELVWHGMQAQVQLVLGTGGFGRIALDNPYFAKVRAGYEGALLWLEAHFDELALGLPTARVSLLEVTLFCLLEHLVFRPMLPRAPYPKLEQFAAEFGKRSSAVATPYVLD